MNIQKMFLLSFSFVASMNFVEACDLTAEPTCGRKSPQWSSDAKIDDFGAKFSSDTRRGDGLPNIKEARQYSVEAASTQVEMQRAKAYQAAAGLVNTKLAFK